MDHRNDKKSITVFDEEIGPKNTHHTISLLSRYISSVVADHPWIKRVRVFLDNAGSTNKNRYLFSWGMEFVEGHQLDHLRFCFLLAGHTKFSPDRLFSLVANEYNREDVFIPEDLHWICSRFSTASIKVGTAFVVAICTSTQVLRAAWSTQATRLFNSTCGRQSCNEGL